MSEAAATGLEAGNNTPTRRVRPRRQAQATPPPARRTPRVVDPTAGGESGLGMGSDGDMAAMITAIIQSQNENQLAIAAASNASMIAFHTATAQALATKSGDKDSKLTAMKK